MRSTSRFTLHGCLAILLVGIPAGATLAATLAGPNAQPVSGIPEQRGLAFYQYLVDLGPVRPAEEVFARFGFVNTGTKPITIQDIVPSCGCLKPRLRKDIKTYAPGQSGDFQVRVKTANEKAGDREYTIRVKYNDPQPREELLTFRVTLPENQVSITPRAMTIYQLNGKPSVNDFYITDHRPQPLSPMQISTTSDLVRAELGPQIIDESGHSKYRVRVTVDGKVPSKKTFAQVKILTNDSTYRMLTIPLAIQGASVVARGHTGPSRDTQTH